MRRLSWVVCADPKCNYEGPSGIHTSKGHVRTSEGASATEEEKSMSRQEQRERRRESWRGRAVGFTREKGPGAKGRRWPLEPLTPSFRVFLSGFL